MELLSTRVADDPAGIATALGVLRHVVHPVGIARQVVVSETAKVIGGAHEAYNVADGVHFPASDGPFRKPWHRNAISDVLDKMLPTVMETMREV